MSKDERFHLKWTVSDLLAIHNRLARYKQNHLFVFLIRHKLHLVYIFYPLCRHNDDDNTLACIPFTFTFQWPKSGLDLWSIKLCSQLVWGSASKQLIFIIIVFLWCNVIFLYIFNSSVWDGERRWSKSAIPPSRVPPEIGSIKWIAEAAACIGSVWRTLLVKERTYGQMERKLLTSPGKLFFPQLHISKFKSFSSTPYLQVLGWAQRQWR